MNKKKLILVFLVVIIIGVIAYFIINNITISKNEDESYLDYIPQEEISDEQLQETSISLYFLNPETNQLKSEGKLVNANDLLQNPYKFIVQKLIEGPSDKSLINVFPDNTRLIDASLQNTCVTLNFSDDLLKFKDDAQKFNIINSILNSLAQLNEVNSIKIQINGNINSNLN